MISNSVGMFSPTQITLNWKPRFNSLRSICDVILSKPTWLRGYTDCCGAFLSWIVVIIAEESVSRKDPSMSNCDGKKGRRRRSVEKLLTSRGFLHKIVRVCSIGGPRPSSFQKREPGQLQGRSSARLVSDVLAAKLQGSKLLQPKVQEEEKYS